MMYYDIPAKHTMIVNKSDPQPYAGHQSITFYRMVIEELPTPEIMTCIANEVQRVKYANTYEAILVLPSSKNNTQTVWMNLLVRQIPDAVIHTYNMKGLVCYIPPRLVSPLIDHLKTENITRKKVKCDRTGNIFHFNNALEISELYTMLKAIGEHCVVTIGSNKIKRGMSFVSKDTESPLTATTMLVRGSDLWTAVYIAQALGRVTGKAMPDIPRRVYTDTPISSTYQAYCANQERIMDAIHEAQQQGGEAMLRDIMGTVEVQRYHRKTDTKALRRVNDMFHLPRRAPRDDDETA
jgi:hypothetical protein